ncbi:MAG TPA: hypothetical protein VN132_09155 [Bdellovibrio sp.]|nr:hypothetical protein [Bdellovibrio sp.]
MKIIAIFFIILSLVACSKPDPNPELKDPIYTDLQAQLATTTSSLEAEKKKLEGFQKDLNEAIPQSGQIKYAQKRFYESQALITRLEQEKSYLELKIEQRKKISVSSYREAFKKKEPWPDPKEFASYQAEQKLRKAKKAWDVKDRMKEAGLSFNSSEKEKPSKEGSEKSEKKE